MSRRKKNYILLSLLDQKSSINQILRIAILKFNTAVIYIKINVIFGFHVLKLSGIKLEFRVSRLSLSIKTNTGPKDGHLEIQNGGHVHQHYSHN